MTKRTQNHRSVIFAAITAIILMLAVGVMHRAVLARLSTPTGEIHIDPSALEGLPMQIGHWAGTTTTLDEEIARRTSADAILSRRYVSETTSQTASLYIACGMRTSEIMIHHPEVCYPGNGWTLLNRDVIELPVDDSLKLPCRIFQFTRGMVEQEKVTVLHYLVVDGSPRRDVSLARSSLWRLTEKVDYVAQIQIICPSTANLTADMAREVACNFAKDSAPAIVQLLRSLEEDKSATEEQTDAIEAQGAAENG